MVFLFVLFQFGLCLSFLKLNDALLTDN